MGIIAIKTERTQIHFLSDVLVAVTSLDLEVPYSKRSGGTLGGADYRLEVGRLKGESEEILLVSP